MILSHSMGSQYQNMAV